MADTRVLTLSLTMGSVFRFRLVIVFSAVWWGPTQIWSGNNCILCHTLRIISNSSLVLIIDHLLFLQNCICTWRASDRGGRAEHTRVWRHWHQDHWGWGHRGQGGHWPRRLGGGQGARAAGGVSIILFLLEEYFQQDFWNVKPWEKILDIQWISEADILH